MFLFLLCTVVYSKAIGEDDAGAIINDKEDALWNPRKQYSTDSCQTNTRKRPSKNACSSVDRGVKQEIEASAEKKAKKSHGEFHIHQYVVTVCYHNSEISVGIIFFSFKIIISCQ